MFVLSEEQLRWVSGGDDSNDIVVVGDPDDDWDPFPDEPWDPWGDDGGISPPPPGSGPGSTTPPPEPDIIVNGLRIDPGDNHEKLLEREWIANGAYPTLGTWANAEFENGNWVIRQSSAPTADQKLFKDNFDRVTGSLWGTLNASQQASLASAFTDFGVDLVHDNINVGAAYSDYKDLLAAGTVVGSSVNDFVSWVHNGGR